jgi:hypothetical protein
MRLARLVIIIFYSNSYSLKNFLTRTAVETTKQKHERRNRNNKPKPEEQECMPQYRHCPPTPTAILSDSKTRNEYCTYLSI